MYSHDFGFHKEFPFNLMKSNLAHEFPRNSNIHQKLPFAIK
jgi:hypothetical protein